jgi:hypothetical protein
MALAMKNTSIPKMKRPEGMSRIWAAGSRVALLLAAIVVLVMPFTEYFWHFDKFLRGGQDFELGLLSVATIFCLAMILLQNGKRSVSLLLSMRKWLCNVFHIKDPAAPGSFMGLIASLHAIAVPSPSLGHYTLPLHI